MRIIGVEIPDKERIEVGLTRIFGIGSNNVKKLIKVVKLDPNLRVKDLSRDNVSTLMKALEEFRIEGDLKKEIRENIDRLKAIKSYRGIRHIVNLPARGQRTKTNARTVKGKKKTVGSLTKEAWAKIEAQQKSASKVSNQ